MVLFWLEFLLDLVFANIQLDLLARTTTEVWDEVDEKRRMTIAVSRYSKQAKNLIDNAGRGIFPSIKAMPKNLRI